LINVAWELRPFPSREALLDGLLESGFRACRPFFATQKSTRHGKSAKLGGQRKIAGISRLFRRSRAIADAADRPALGARMSSAMIDDSTFRGNIAEVFLPSLPAGHAKAVSVFADVERFSRDRSSGQGY
jgi:hypothetical protein